VTDASDRLLYYRHGSSLEHDPSALAPKHPDIPARIEAIETGMRQAGWPGCEVREAPAATKHELALVHGAAHIETIRALCAAGGGEIDSDTFVGEAS
jgi:acetoin utilization deacetylase AcuC-like enzyme